MKALFLRILLITLPIHSDAAEFDGTESALRQVVANSVSDALKVPAESVQLGTFDRRLQINPCERKVAISFPFTDNRDTIRIDCEEPDWHLFLPIRIETPQKVWMLNHAVPKGGSINRDLLTATDSPLGSNQGISIDQTILGWIATRNLPSGHIIQISDVGRGNRVMIATDTISAGSLIDDSVIDYKTLTDQQIDPLKVPQRINQADVLRATQSIRAMSPLTTENTEVLQPVLIVSENLPRETIIEARHIEQKFVKSTDLGRRVIRDPAAAIGLQTMRALRIGHILNSTDLADAVLVRKGESVTLVLSAGALEIRADTLALEDGKKGDQVRLQNLDSGKTIRATVIGRNLAKRQ